MIISVISLYSVGFKTVAVQKIIGVFEPLNCLQCTLYSSSRPPTKPPFNTSSHPYPKPPSCHGLAMVSPRYKYTAYLLVIDHLSFDETYTETSTPDNTNWIKHYHLLAICHSLLNKLMALFYILYT